MLYMYINNSMYNSILYYIIERTNNSILYYRMERNTFNFLLYLIGPKLDNTPFNLLRTGVVDISTNQET